MVHQSGSGLEDVGDTCVPLIFRIPNQVRLISHLQRHAGNEIGLSKGSQSLTASNGETDGYEFGREETAIDACDSPVKTHGLGDDAAARLRIGLVDDREPELARIKEDHIQPETVLCGGESNFMVASPWVQCLWA